MPVLTPYKLAFHSGLHLGTRGVNQAEAGVHLPSDTLFSSLIVAWRYLDGDVDAFAAPFLADDPAPPFLLSSAFPFAGNVRFYPMPVTLSRLFSPGTLGERGKAIKRIRYLSEGLLFKALAGEKLDECLFPENEYVEPTTGVALQGGAAWLLVDEIEGLPAKLKREPDKRHALRNLKLWAAERVPRVTVDRINSASNIYHTGRTVFADGCGLWFGIEWRQPEARVGENGPSYQALVEKLLALKQHEGLGGERTVGYGAFEYAREEPVTLPDPRPGEPVWLLSRYHPRCEDELPGGLTHSAAAYTLFSVGGWLQSPDSKAQRRKRLHLVAEGSIVCPPAHPAGDVSDVRPTHQGSDDNVPHPVYRYGFALALNASQLQEVGDA